MKTYVTLTEAGRKLGVSRQQVRKYINSRRIKLVMIGGRPFVEAAGLRKPQPRKPGPKPRAT